jgi:dTDP-glucose pyrophosphorylase
MDYRNRDILPSKSLLEALKQMDTLDKKLLIVLEKDKFKGLISAGDIQRAIIQNRSLETTVINVLRNNIRVAKPEDSYESITKMMLDFRMELCPIVDKNNNILNIYFWEEIFQNKKPQSAKQFNLPVIIMAGGLGSRLKPLTNVLPKPLIPIGEKSIIEEIIDRFGDHGCKDFYISVNYKSQLIEYYLRHQNLPYNLKFFKEEKPMGTAGSLSLLKDTLYQTLFVSNCDILVEQDYSEILDFHYENKNEITLVAALKRYLIPYGTVETGENGQLLDIKERPEILLKINSGMYILESNLLSEIPRNHAYHMTDLIEKVKERKGNIGVFPVSEKSWKDIGAWDEYFKEVLKEK